MYRDIEGEDGWVVFLVRTGPVRVFHSHYRAFSGWRWEWDWGSGDGGWAGLGWVGGGSASPTLLCIMLDTSRAASWLYEVTKETKCICRSCTDKVSRGDRWRGSWV